MTLSLSGSNNARSFVGGDHVVALECPGVARPANEIDMSDKKPVSRSGRFTSGPNRDVVEFTESISFDRRLWRQDIMGSIAHAAMLRHIGILAEEEEGSIREGLEAIGREILDGRFDWREDLEDVHMNIEAALTARTPAGGKLHTGRSRNDQVALDPRLWMRDELVHVTCA